MDIVLDLIILMAVMGVLGYAFDFIKDRFTPAETPVDAVVSVIRKADLNDATGRDESFLRTLQERRETDGNFINAADNTGRTMLMWACYVNFNDPGHVFQEDMVRLYYLRLLLEQPGARADMKDKDGFTALHWAGWSGLAGCAFELHRQGVDIDQPESNGYTPLMLASIRGNASVVRLLLQLGADASLKNARGETALDLAEQSARAYEASESSLLSWWRDSPPRQSSPYSAGEDASKGSGDAFFYSPIYSKGRSIAHRTCIELLKNPPERASDEELSSELAEREASARARRMEAAAKARGKS